MSLLPILQDLQVRKQQGQDCGDLLQDIGRELGRFRAVMRRMARGQLAEEDAILNEAAYSIFNAIGGFCARTEEESVAYCRRAVITKTISHFRAAKGELLFSEGKTSRISGYEKNPEEESIGEGRDPEAISKPKGSNPETLVWRREISQMVSKALDHLNPLERELIERVELYDERITDIAKEILQREILDPPSPKKIQKLENSLTKKKTRALLKLRKYLPTDLKEDVL